METGLKERLQDIKDAKKVVEQVLNANIHAKNRERANVDARMLYSKLLREMGMSLKSIGATLNKDHSSIVHYLDVINRLIESDKTTQLNYLRCKEKYYENRQPEYVGEEKAISKQLAEAEKKINKLMLELDKISNTEIKYERLSSIINLIDSRTPRGKERSIERRINLMFNGLENIED